MNQTEKLTFKQAFCAHYKCDPDGFLSRALLYAYYPHAAFFARILVFFQTKSAKLGIEAIDQLGKARDLEEAITILNDYRYQLRLHKVSSFIDLLRIRISGKRVLDLFIALQLESNASTTKSAKQCA